MRSGDYYSEDSSHSSHSLLNQAFIASQLDSHSSLGFQDISAIHSPVLRSGEEEFSQNSWQLIDEGSSSNSNDFNGEGKRLSITQTSLPGQNTIEDRLGVQLQKSMKKSSGRRAISKVDLGGGKEGFEQNWLTQVLRQVRDRPYY